MQGRTVAEVCEQLDLKPHVLRYWEEQVPWLSPERSLSGHRVYTEAHIHLLFRFKYLLEQRGFTLQGAAEQIVRENTGEAVNVKSRLHPLRFELLELRSRIAGSRHAVPEQDSHTGAKRHPVEEYLPGISRIPLQAQLRLLQDYTAFLPEFRTPLIEFLYPELMDTGKEAPLAAYEIQRPVNRLPEHSTGEWGGSRELPLLLVAPVYSSAAAGRDIQRLHEALSRNKAASAVLLVVPGSDDDFGSLIGDFSLQGRIAVQAMPVFPDITPENRLLLSPDRMISRYFPGPGIALQSVLGDPGLSGRIPGFDINQSFVWYRPIGLPDQPFRLPPGVLPEWLVENGAAAAVPAAPLRSYSNRGNQSRLQACIGIRLSPHVPSVLSPGLQGSGMVRDSISVINRLDQSDDIVVQEVRRVRSSVTDIAQRSLYVSIYIEE